MVKILHDIIEKLAWFKKIEVLRVSKGWSQEETAAKCFTNQKTYWNWEKGESYPRKNSRRAISQAFEVAEDEIFNRRMEGKDEP